MVWRCPIKKHTHTHTFDEAPGSMRGGGHWGGVPKQEQVESACSCFVFFSGSKRILPDKCYTTAPKQRFQRKRARNGLASQVTYTKKRSMELPKETPNWWMPCRLDSLSVLLHGEDVAAF